MFHSILFKRQEDEQPTHRLWPDLFFDLHIDHIVDGVLQGRNDEALRGVFDVPLSNAEAVVYRQDVFRDAERPDLFQALKAFTDGMTSVREAQRLAKKSSYLHERNRWTLDAAMTYCEQVQGLLDILQRGRLISDGFTDLRDYLERYASSNTFASLRGDADLVSSKLAAISYRIIVAGGRLIVRDDAPGGDLVAEVQETFERFRKAPAKSHLLTFRDPALMNHIEAKILDFVARLNHTEFLALDSFASAHASFVDQTIERFDREVQFYLAWIDYLTHFVNAGLPTCYPDVVAGDKTIVIEEGYDLALADHALASQAPVVRNDLSLGEGERMLIISGPNQAGKTTLARMFGQVHYLAALGCKVPGRAARTFMFDQLLTHFEREEDPTSLRSKLEDDLTRMRDILGRATTRSIIILNEIFASTTAQDAALLSRRVLQQISDLDAPCACVTFIDELATLSDKAVSFASIIDPTIPERRTFRFERRAPDGLAYALSLAQKYDLTYPALTKRLKEQAAS